MRDSINIACRLEVLSDLVASARANQSGLAAALDAINQLTAALANYVDPEDTRPIPKLLATEVALLTQ